MATKYVFTSSNGYAYKIGEQYIAIPDPSLYVNDTYIPFSPEGGYQDVSVWTTFMNSWQPFQDAAPWLSFSNIVNPGGSGNGWGSFRVTASANNTADRTSEFYIVAKYSDDWTIDVSQNKVVVADSINIYPTWQSWAGNEASDSKAFSLTSSGAWTATVTSDTDNIIYSYDNAGFGSGTVYVALYKPDKRAARYAQIRYTCGTANVWLDLCIAGTFSGACLVP